MDERREKLVRGISYRVGIALIAVFAAVFAFHAGVAVSGQPDIPNANLLTKIYYALGLFVLGGLDLGVPSSGPNWGQGLLWMAYFACPAIATAAVVEGVTRMLRRRTDRLAGLTDHIIVAGDSRVAEAYLETFSENQLESRDIVVVHPEDQSAPREDGTTPDEVIEVSGDLTSHHFGQKLRVAHASRVLLLTEQDITNLEVGLSIIEHTPLSPECVVVHLSDIALKRDVENATTIPDEMTIFNAHEIAAEHLLEARLESFFDSTSYSDQVILAGFGRFGQSMLDQLDRKLPGEFRTVVLIDRRADFQYRVFREQVELDCNYRVETIDGDIRDPEVWRKATNELAEVTEEPVVVLGADDDAVNLQVALWLQRKLPKASLFVRTVDSSLLANRMAERRRFQIEDVLGRARDYMDETLGG